jgi:hypothetical protein
MISSFRRLQKLDDSSEIIVNIANVTALYPEFPARTEQDPFPPPIGTRIPMSPDKLIIVRETPDSIVADDPQGLFIMVSTDPIRVHVNRSLIVLVEQARVNDYPGPGVTDVHLAGHQQPLRIFETVDELEDRIRVAGS